MPIVQLSQKEVRLLAVTLGFAEGGMRAGQWETQVIKDVAGLRERFKALVTHGEGDCETVQSAVKMAAR